MYTRLPPRHITREEEREARVHPHKCPVVGLLARCGEHPRGTRRPRSTLKKTHDMKSIDNYMKTKALTP